MTAPSPQRPVPAHADAAGGVGPDRQRPKPSPVRRARRIVRATALSLLMVLLTLAVGLRAGALRWVVLPALERAIGCEADAQSVRLTSSGTIYIEQLKLSAPNVEAVAATFFDAPFVEITPRWGALLTGGVPVERIAVRRPTITISQDQNMALNIAGLGGKGAGGTLDVLPGVELHDGTLALAEHGPGWINPLVALRVEGRIARPDPRQPRYTLELTGAQPGASTAEVIRITGDYDLAAQTGEIALDNLDLSRFRDTPVPEAFADRWGRMNISGSVRSARLTYNPADGPAAYFSVRDVSLNVPLPDESEAERLRSANIGPERPEAGLLAMRRVTGDLKFSRDESSADLHGLIEDLPCRVEFTLRGAPADGALTARITTPEFSIAERPKLLPFAPFYVKRNFQRFSGPTALLTGVVDISRAAATPTGPAPLEVKGRIDFTRGTAGFEKFPYPFENMRGTILFDDQKVDIVSITGRGPTGASLLAKGRIAPPADGAAVDLEIAVVDVPTDDVLFKAVPERRRALVDLLMNAGALAELTNAGLIADAAATSRGATPSTPANGGAAATPPRFAMGGVGTIQVKIHRDFGEDAEYMTNVDVHFPTVGLLSDAFAYPVQATDVRLRISDERVSLNVPAFKGLTGASGKFTADVLLGEGDARDEYDVRADVSDVPIDAIAKAALRRFEEKRSRTGTLSPSALVERLGLAGVMDVSAAVASAPEGEVRYDVDMHFGALRADLGRGCLRVDGIAGSLFVSDAGIETIGLVGVAGASAFTADLLAIPSSDALGYAVTAKVEAPAFDLGERVEDLLAAIAPGEARTLESMRASFAPTGRVGASLALTSAGGTTEFDLALGLHDTISARVFDSELRLTPSAGSVRLTPRSIELRGLEGALSIGGVDNGALRLDGRWPLIDGESGSVAVSLPAGRVESGAVRSIASRVNETLGKALHEHDVRGAFGLEGRLVRAAQGEPEFDGVIEPRSLSFDRAGSRITFDQVGGRVVVRPGGGEVRHVTAESPGWSLSLDGAWTSGPSVEADLTLGLTADGLPPELRAVLPERARSAIEAAGLELEGMIHAPDARLTYRSAPSAPGASDGNGGMVRLQTAATFDRARLDAGFPLTLAAGSCQIDLRVPLDDAGRTLVSGEVRARDLDAAGVPMHDAVVRIRSGDAPGTYLVPNIEAKFLGGTLTGDAVLRNQPAAAGVPERVTYDAELVVGGVDFGALVSSLGSAAQASPELMPQSSQPTRGELDGSFSIAGVVGDVSQRRGRGQVRVRDGEVISLPGAMPLMRLSNLQPPMGERLESALASFYLRGNTLTFERLEASSPSVTILGEGTMQFPSTAIDLRFNTRGKLELPVISDLFRGVRDELMTAVMVGTLAEPEFKLQSLPATQRMLGTIFRTSPATTVRAQERNDE
jgi:hypothetical protein